MEKTDQQEITLEMLRHSTAHIMAAAVVELFPETKVAIGPAIADGFYYDFDRPQPFTPEDLKKIEKKMFQIIEKNIPFEKEVWPKEKAKKFFAERNEKYKLEIIEEIPDDTVSIYHTGNFTDLCRGPHIPTTGMVQNFRLLSVAGAYWRGDEKREQLQRIYGTAFFTDEELQKYLKNLEEAKKRDHRLLGTQLKLFSVHEEVGPGLIHWHPRGTILRKIITDYWEKFHQQQGYLLVTTPHIASEEIYKISGHLQNYADLMYAPMDIEGHPYRVKPMNCPGHIMIYQTEIHSWRDLPYRLAEMGTVYRFEKSGVLHGLLRVRGFTIDDAHIFVSPEELEAEVQKILDMAFQFLRKFGFGEFAVYLATRPKEKFVGEIASWEMAEKSLKEALNHQKISYEIDEGGGAFYGPKIDIKVQDCLGRPWQCSTIQFDFNLPERFKIYYVDKDGKQKRPFLIHRALLGSLERFIGVLIEHYGGAFPLWLAPQQIALINITDEQLNYVEKIAAELRRDGWRTEIDNRNVPLGNKIRQATLNKVPVMLIAGKKEENNQTVDVRLYPAKNIGAMNIAELKNFLIFLIRE